MKNYRLQSSCANCVFSTHTNDGVYYCKPNDGEIVDACGICDIYAPTPHHAIYQIAMIANVWPMWKQEHTKHLQADSTARMIANDR